MIAPKGFHHVAIVAKDVETVAAFYREVLGLPELCRFHFPDGRLRSIWVGARAQGGPTEGFFAVEAGDHRDAPSPTRGGFAMVALAIDAAHRDQARSALLRLGLAVERETAFTLYVRDPEGNLVGLSHYPEGTGPTCEEVERGPKGVV